MHIKAGLCWVLGLFMSMPGFAQLKVVDDMGRELVLDQAAQRIVALAPHLVESLFAIGAGERIIATVAWADYPAAAKSIPRLGRHHKISVESVMAFKPDLVLMWGSGNGQDVLQKLQALGIPVYVSEPKSLADVAHAMRRLGVLSGASATAQQKADEFEQRVAKLRSEFADKQKLSVFYQIWHDPLQTINGDHLISAVLSLCGGQNVFADAVALAPRTSIESVLSIDPQLIIAGQEKQRVQQFWQPWSALQAVRNGRLIMVNPDIMHRHAPRIIEGAERLCADMDRLRRGIYAEGDSS